MEIVKSLLLICILLVYPLLPGGILLGIIKKKKDDYGLGSVYIAGVLSCGVLFGMLAFFGVRTGMMLDRFSRAALLLALLLLIFCAVLIAVVRRLRQPLLRALSGLKKKPGRAELYIVLAFLFVAGLYVMRPFSIEPAHDTAEKVVTCLDTGLLTGTDALTGELAPAQGNWRQQLENLPVFYACLCRWSGLSPTDVLFCVIPYAVLVFAFFTISAFADFAFHTHKMSRVAALVLFAIITLCGNTAYMNTSYGFLHYPYEAMTIFSSILLPLAFYFVWSRAHVVMLLMLCINAVFAVGVQKAVVLMALMGICYALAVVVTRLAERRAR